MSGGEIRVEVFGKFQVTKPTNAPARFRTIRAAEVVARMTLQRSRRITREQLAEELWPDQDKSSQLRNLRPALTYARTALEDPEAVTADHRDLVLASRVLSDWEVANRQERAILAASNGEERLVQLLVLDNLVQPPLMEGWDSPWIEAFRIGHDRRREDVLRQIAEEFGARGNWESGIETTRKMLLLNPLSESGIKLRIRFLGQQGNSRQAKIDYDQYKSRLADELGLSPDEDLERVARRVIAGKASEAKTKPLTSFQQELIHHMITMLADEDPERMMTLFASPKLNWEVVLHGPELRPWLERLLEHKGPWTADRSGVAKRLLQFYNQDLRIWEQTQLAQQLLLQGDETDRVAALNYQGFSSASMQEYGQAMQQFEEAARIANGLGNRYLAAVSMGNYGVTQLAAGQPQEAEKELNQAIADLAVNLEPNGRYSTARLKLDLVSCALAQGEVVRARRYVKDWQKWCETHDLTSQMGAADCLLGYLRISEGQKRGAATATNGIEWAVRSRRKVIIASAVKTSEMALRALGEKSEADMLGRKLDEFHFESGRAPRPPEGGRRLVELASEAHAALSGSGRDPYTKN